MAPALHFRRAVKARLLYAPVMLVAMVCAYRQQMVACVPLLTFVSQQLYR